MTKTETEILGRLNHCDNHVEAMAARGEKSKLAGSPGSTDRPSSLLQLTVFDHPETKLHSEYGFVTFFEWCRREMARINSGGRKKADLIYGLVAIGIQNL